MKNYAQKGNELYDLTDPVTDRLYQEIKTTGKAGVISRDTTSFDEITEDVQKTASRFSGDGVVILSGAYSHIIGAIVQLARTEKYNIQYVPMSDTTISTQTLDMGKPITSDQIKVQMERTLGVVKHFGFSDMEEVRQYLDAILHDPSKPTITFIVENETGHHGVYTYPPYQEARRKLYDYLREWVNDQRPSFILYSGEDANLEGYNMMLKNKDAHTPSQKFLVDAKEVGHKVVVGAFGHRDRQDLDSIFRLPFGRERQFSLPEKIREGSKFLKDFNFDP